MKKIINNILHVPSTFIGLFVMATATFCLYKGIIEAEGYVCILTVAAFPILGVGKKETNE